MKGALFSDCGKYRYLLTRELDNRTFDDNACTFVMLNPSTADAFEDDPTIRRCRGFANSFGFTGFLVINLYAFRSPKPDDLKLELDPIGPDNQFMLEHVAQSGSHTVICAWGTKAEQKVVDDFIELCKKHNKTLHCIKITNDGHPGHPLYLKSDLPLQVFKDNSNEAES